MFWLINYFWKFQFHSKHGQLQVNSKVEVCFFNPGVGTGTMMRVAGKFEFMDNLNLKKKAMEEISILKKSGLTFDDPSIIVE